MNYKISKESNWNTKVMNMMMQEQVAEFRKNVKESNDKIEELVGQHVLMIDQNGIKVNIYAKIDEGDRFIYSCDDKDMKEFAEAENKKLEKRRSEVLSNVREITKNALLDYLKNN